MYLRVVKQLVPFVGRYASPNDYEEIALSLASKAGVRSSQRQKREGIAHVTREGRGLTIKSYFQSLYYRMTFTRSFDYSIR